MVTAGWIPQVNKKSLFLLLGLLFLNIRQRSWVIGGIPGWCDLRYLSLVLFVIRTKLSNVRVHRSFGRNEIIQIGTANPFFLGRVVHPVRSRKRVKFLSFLIIP